MTNWDNDKYWENTGQSFNLDEDKQPSKYKFEGISKFSNRKHVQPIISTTSSSAKTISTNVGGPVSILVESDLECNQQLLCFSCNKLITQEDAIRFEGKRIFTNEMCWKHWIKKMVESSDNFQTRDLWSHEAKQYFLHCVCSSCNGQLITKILLIFKDSMGEFEFGSLLYDNPIAYNHYMSFLRETHQINEKLMRCRNSSDEPMKNFRDIVNDNCNVTPASAGQFIRKLVELRDEMKLNSNSMVIQTELIGEYVSLLTIQNTDFQILLNQPLIGTLIQSKLSHQSVTDSSKVKYLKENFKVTPEEFFWTALDSMVKQNQFVEIEKALNHKGFGSRPDVTYERIVSFLYSLSKEPDEMKMRCLLKISDIGDLIDCAKLYGLLKFFMDFCKQRKEKSMLNKVNSYLETLNKH